MKKITLTLFILLTLSQAKELSLLEKYAPFLAGEYRMIGQNLDSNQTYSGMVTLVYEGNTLLVTREINHKIQKGIGRIEEPFIQSPKLLEIKFLEGDKTVKIYYLWQTEFDNYARLTGSVMQGNKKVAYEALFAQHH